MARELMRRVAAVATSVVLLSGAAAMAGGQAFAAPSGHHPAHHPVVHHMPKGNRDGGWDHGVDKRKDKWDSKHRCWMRYDDESRGWAKWDDRHHCWTRVHQGHNQKWDNRHHCWK